MEEWSRDRVNEVIDRQIRGLTKVLVRTEDASEVRGRSSVYFLTRAVCAFRFERGRARTSCLSLKHRRRARARAS